MMPRKSCSTSSSLGLNGKMFMRRRWVSKMLLMLRFSIFVTILWLDAKPRIDYHHTGNCFQTNWRLRCAHTFVSPLVSNSWSRRLSPKLPRRRTRDILTRSSQHKPSLLRHPDKVTSNKRSHKHTQTHRQTDGLLCLCGVDKPQMMWLFIAFVSWCLHLICWWATVRK